MIESNSTPPEQNKHRRWDRSRAAAVVINFEEAKKRQTSQRQFALESGLPRTTLQYFLSCKDRIDAERALVDFFESPVGLAFLHQIVVAAHFAFTQVGPCSIYLLQEFLELSKLDRFVAASYGTQYEVSKKMQAEILAYGKEEWARLAVGMEHKDITICQDENFHQQTCLVAIEPVSDLIIVEQYTEHRDAETWDETVNEGMDGLNVKVVQSCSDEAKGIVCHVEEKLGAHHSPDLFHGLNELNKATCLQLNSRVSKASEKVAEAEKRMLEAKQEFEDYRLNPPQGFPPDFPKRIALAGEAAQEARLELERAKELREQMGENIRNLSVVYHPYDLSNGNKVEAKELEERLRACFAEIDRLAEEAQLSDGSIKRIDKARRLNEGFVATIAFFHQTVEMWVRELGLRPEIEQIVLTELIPALYLQCAAKKQKTAKGKAKVKAVYEPMLERLRGPASELSKLPEADRIKVEKVAEQAANLFQRSSSCVEGRNGQLSLRHHSLHRLSSSKLGALTVVHNFYLTRSDGTTPAERFFGAKPRGLFEWLLDRIEMPARPAKKRSKNKHKAA